MKASAKLFDMTLTGLRPGTVFTLETLDKDHGYVYNDYEAIGAPRSLSVQQTRWLKEKAWQTQKETLTVAPDGTLNIRRQLQPWSCVLLQQM